MNHRIATPCLDGVDAQAQQIITQRWPYILQFVDEHVRSLIELSGDDRQALDGALQRFEQGAILMPEHSQSLLMGLEQVERNLTGTIYHPLAPLTRGMLAYRTDILLPLAQPLHLLDKVFRTCFEQGHFDHPDSDQPDQFVRPAWNTLIACLRSHIDPTLSEDKQVQCLLSEGIGRDRSTAYAIANGVRQAIPLLAQRTHLVVQGALTYGPVGTLVQSSYDCTDLLLMLQRHGQHIARMAHDTERDADAIIATLRADLIALYRVLSGVPGGNRKRSLWLENLLHMPPTDQLRNVYRQQITPKIWESVIAKLMQQRACAEEETATLFDAFVTGGIPGLIDWRCSVSADTTQHTLTVERIHQAIELHLAALQPNLRQLIAHRALCLYRACQETGIHLPIVRLLNDYPSSRYRRQVGRRFSFGAGALAQRRASNRRKKRYLHIRRRPPTEKQKKLASKRAAARAAQQQAEDHLVEAFSRLADLSPVDKHREGRTFVRQLIYTGGIGLLPKAQWGELLDERVTRALAFFKLSRPFGVIGWPDTLQRVREYSRSLGLPAPSSQLAKAVSNAEPKPTRWHGGDGPAVRQVRQRKTLMLDAPRLHETWLVMPVKKRLHLSIVDAAGRQVSDTCRALLVFDTAIERPVGYWLSTTAPNSREVGLLLYQAIWHPGALTWPLRGVPDCIQIPEMLVSDGIGDVERAAVWMHSNTETITRRQMDYALRTKLPYAAKLLDTLAEQAPDYVRWKTGREAVTLQQAMDALRTWLHIDKITRTDPHAQAYPVADCFPNHNAPDVPASIADYGVALPGHHLPAAGWLLPVAEHTATTVRDAVEYRSMTYTDAGFRSEPGSELPVRMFLYWYRNMEQGIFVEAAAEELRYLVRQA